MDPYDVALLQTRTHVVRTVDERDEIVTRNIRRIEDLVKFAGARMGDIKIAVTGEYSLLGQFRPRTIEQWLEIAMPIPNKYTDMLADIAQRYDTYLTGHMLELLPGWEGRYFNTGLLFSPQGEIILKYHKHNGPNNLNTTYTAPGDVYTRYVEEFGEDQLFPVVDTPIGRMGMFICGDIQYPEVSRALAMKGAEILLYPTADIYRRAQEGWQAMKRARAAENGVYLLSASTGAFMGTDRPEEGYRGGSEIYGPDGATLGLADGPGEAVITAQIDVDRLRLRKTKIGKSGHIYNQMALMRSDLYAAEYQRANRWPNDGFLAEPIQSTDGPRQLAGSIIARLQSEGQILGPA